MNEEKKEHSTAAISSTLIKRKVYSRGRKRVSSEPQKKKKKRKKEKKRKKNEKPIVNALIIRSFNEDRALKERRTLARSPRISFDSNEFVDCSVHFVLARTNNFHRRSVSILSRDISSRCNHLALRLSSSDASADIIPCIFEFRATVRSAVFQTFLLLRCVCSLFWPVKSFSLDNTAPTTLYDVCP